MCVSLTQTFHGSNTSIRQLEFASSHRDGTKHKLPQGFYEELKKTFGYIGRVMEEEEGEEINWEVLRQDMQSKRTPYSKLFYIVGKDICITCNLQIVDCSFRRSCLFLL